VSGWAAVRASIAPGSPLGTFAAREWQPEFARKAHRLPEPVAEDRFDPPQPDTHSFVLRVWIEERCDTSGVVRRRGSIVHVQTAIASST
jgi:hypothetical protein